MKLVDFFYQEVFKIPKKEKVEERKRTERELGKNIFYFSFANKIKRILIINNFKKKNQFFFI